MLPGDSVDRLRLGSRNLILTGFMGTGKTAVGQEIARRLGREFVDMDALLEDREAMTVGSIFRQKGEACFRQLEASLCRELAARQELVIATGGGALIPDANREILSASGPVVCLTASPDVILRRLEVAEDRPLLDVASRQARVASLLAERREAYARIPLQVDTTGLAVARVADQVLDVSRRRLTRTLTVHHPSGEYPIHLGCGLLTQVGPLLRQQGLDGQVALVTNPTVGDLYVQSVIGSLHETGLQVATSTVPDGEAHKTLATIRNLYDCFIETGLDRSGVVMALGGGVVGDMVGFAAATYLRGVPLVQLPTTLLAMVDSSVGGKVAVDHPRGKNLVGAFKQPELVIADSHTLSTLPDRELANGFAEVVKAGLIGDPALFEQIEAHGPAPLTWLVERAIRVKTATVEGDPYEQGRRAVLNLGHTFGHALELLSGYALSHGQGISIGLVAAARLSARLGLCDRALVPRIEIVLDRLGLPTRYQDFTSAQIWEAMATDKKRRGKTLRFILLRDVGDVFVTGQVRQREVLAVLESLRGT
jgi:shikimate kinase/3-dehydroquinate synthase